MIDRRLRTAAIGLAVLLAASAAVAHGPQGDGASDQPPAFGALPGGPFELIDDHGRPVSDLDYRGGYLLVAFGYTSCPDICPTTLHTVSVALDLLGRDADRITALFVSVDPERDTPEVLREYVAAFSPRIAGLTGTPRQVATAAAAYKVFHAKAEPADDGFYAVDHSAYVYLMGPDGGYLTHFAHDVGAERMARQIRGHLAVAM